MGPSKADLVLIYAVDQLLDYYEVNSKPMPASVSVDSATYEALRAYTKVKDLTHYRGVALKQVSRNNKT